MDWAGAGAAGAGGIVKARWISRALVDAATGGEYNGNSGSAEPPKACSHLFEPLA
jgi:hypothetical protein